MSESNFYYSFSTRAWILGEQTNESDVSSFLDYLRMIDIADESDVDELADAQWDLAASEAYYLGGREIAQWQKVNSYTFDAWAPLAATISDPSTDRSGVEIGTENADWVSGLGMATYDGQDRALSTYFDVNAADGTPHVEALSAEQLADIRLISINLGRVLLGGESQGVNSGYGLDHGYHRFNQEGNNYYHSGIDYGAVGQDNNLPNSSDLADAVYSPVNGEIVLIETDADSPINRILIWDDVNDTVWLLGHVHPTDELIDLMNASGAVPVRVQAGTQVGFIGDFGDDGNNGDHLHVEVQRFDPEELNLEDRTYDWDGTDADGWGRYLKLGDALDRTLNPLQEFWNYNPGEALKGSENTSVAIDNVTFANEGDLTARGGGGEQIENALTTAAVVAPAVVTRRFESEVAISVLNIGTNTMAGPGAFFVILSDDVTLDTDDLVLATDSFDGELVSGMSYTSILSVDWSQVADAGQYYLIAGYLDPNDETLTDRYIVRDITVHDDSITDVSIQSATLQSSNFIAGQDIEISVLSQNLADRTSGTSTLVLEVRNGGDWVQIGSESVASLPGGARTVDTMQGTLPDEFDGNLDVRVRLDNGSDVNLDNNLVRFDTVQVNQLAQTGQAPDVEVQSDTIYAASIDTTTEVEVFTFTTGEGGLHRLTFSEPDYLELRVYNSSGQQLATSRLDRIRYEDTEYMFQAPDAGIFTIEITSNRGYTGGFTLQVSADLQGVPFQHTDGDDFVYASRYIDATYDLMNGRDNFDGQSGIDHVYGGGGDDRIETGSGNDLLDGGAGIDNLFGQSGDDTIFGGDAFDYLDGGTGNDLLYGGASGDSLTYLGDGNDTAYGGTGDDTFNREDRGGSATMYGGDGQDTLYLSTWGTDINVNLATGAISGAGLSVDFISGIENMFTGSGNDVLSGTTDPNNLRGQSGDDTLFGLAGDDRIYGGSGDDSLLGGDGEDYLSGGSGNDTVQGGAGADEIHVEAIDGDVLDGGGDGDVTRLDMLRSGVTVEEVAGGYIAITSVASGTTSLFRNIETFQFEDGTYSQAELLSNEIDVVPVFLGDNSFVGSQTTDWLWGSQSANTVFAEGGDDTILGQGGDDVLRGGAGDDYLEGGEGQDILAGNEGNDTVLGDEGDDLLAGNNGADVLFGGDGKDRIFGGDDEDILYGGSGRDDLAGADNDDVLYGNSAKDTVDGGKGYDTLFGGSGDDALSGGSGRDTLEGGDGDDVLFGDSAKDDLFGSKGGDVLVGGSGDDTLEGGSGRDTLDGGKDDDVLYGGSAIDILFGGTGYDTLDGGSGADVFVFNLNDDNDVILDFENNNDTLELSGFAFTTVAQAQGFAVQNGSDVFFDFGGGDTLTILNITISGLTNDMDVV